MLFLIKRESFQHVTIKYDVGYRYFVENLSQSILAATTTNTTDWVAYNHQKFISFVSGGWESKFSVPAWSGSKEGPVAGYGWPTSYCVLLSGGRGKETLLSHIYKDINHFPKASFPNTIPLGIKISKSKFQGHINSVYNSALRQAENVFLFHLFASCH